MSQKPSKSSSKKEATLIRLNKFISNSGICSRREADMYIRIGNVTVNGKVITEMGYKVKVEDEVRFDGARVKLEKKAYVLLNKPKGFATTTSEGKAGRFWIWFQKRLDQKLDLSEDWAEILWDYCCLPMMRKFTPSSPIQSEVCQDSFISN